MFPASFHRVGYTLPVGYPIRSNVLRMQPYTPGKPIDEVQRELGLSEVVKLASNENPLGPSPKALAAIAKTAGELHLYPDASGYRLRTRLAEHLNRNFDEIALGNGSDELIHLLGLVLLEPGDNIVVGDPSFVRYDAAAHVANCEVRAVPLDSEWKHDLPAMAARCDDRTKLVFIANPHNPTGTRITESELHEFLARVPASAVIVLDEAYFEFAAALPDHPVGTALTGQAKVVCLRTFSKAYGLAGIRIGYAIADPSLIDAINRARAPFHVNSLAQAAAIAALDDHDFLDQTVAITNEGKARLTEEMTKHGFEVIPSYANFMCIDLRQNATPIFECLLRQGVIVRNGGPLGMPNHIRVSIGTHDEMTKFLNAFAVATAEQEVMR